MLKNFVANNIERVEFKVTRPKWLIQKKQRFSTARNTHNNKTSYNIV